MALKPGFKEKWLKDIQSGKYQWGRGILRNGNQHCLLGVACEILANEGLVEVSRPFGQVSFYRHKKDDVPGLGSYLYLSKAILNEIGMTREEEKTITDMNDLSVDMKEVIQYIEDKL